MIDCLLKPQPPLNIAPATAVFIQAKAPSHKLRVSVIVPARNEADNLPTTLSSLYRQLNDKGTALCKESYEVLLLVNNSTDASLDIAGQFQQNHPDFALHIAYVSLPVQKANIGTVRRLLMDEACRRLKQVTPWGIIASTDSDTTVDKNWISNILKEIEMGADAIGGRILTSSNNNPVRIWHLRDVMYRTLLTQAEGLIDPCAHDPWPRHHQYFGANLAVTCAAYEKAGRLPEVPFLEDYALHESLKIIDARIRRSNAVKVYTSDRQQGKVAVGFSEQLQTWSKFIVNKKIQVTEPVEPQVIKWECKKRLRQIHLQFHREGGLVSAELSATCCPLQLPYNWVLNQVETNSYFGKIWQNIENRLIVNRWNEQWLPQPITEAITELRMFISHKPQLLSKRSSRYFSAR